MESAVSQYKLTYRPGEGRVRCWSDKAAEEDGIWDVSALSLSVCGGNFITVH